MHDPATIARLDQYEARLKEEHARLGMGSLVVAAEAKPTVEEAKFLIEKQLFTTLQAQHGHIGYGRAFTAIPDDVLRIGRFGEVWGRFVTDLDLDVRQFTTN